MVHHSKAPDLTGQRFGLLTVIQKTGSKPYGGYAYLCRCDCGTEREISSGSLSRKNGIRSCGCIGRSLLRQRSTTHGLHKHPIYKSWGGMIDRCRNPQHTFFNRYGGRGITVCERWRSFENFRDDMLESWFPGATIERMDVNGNYEPSNCLWATKADQNRNRSNTVWLTHNGETRRIREWAAALGLTPHIIRNRLSSGLPIDEVLGPRKRRAATARPVIRSP